MSPGNSTDPPTDRQLVILRAYLDKGSHREAAKALGLKETYVRQMVSECIKATGTKNATQAGIKLGLPRPT